MPFPPLQALTWLGEASSETATVMQISAATRRRRMGEFTSLRPFIQEEDIDKLPPLEGCKLCGAAR